MNRHRDNILLSMTLIYFVVIYCLQMAIANICTPGECKSLGVYSAIPYFYVHSLQGGLGIITVELYFILSLIYLIAFNLFIYRGRRIIVSNIPQAILFGSLHFLAIFMWLLGLGPGGYQFDEIQLGNFFWPTVFLACWTMFEIFTVEVFSKTR